MFNYKVKYFDDDYRDSVEYGIVCAEDYGEAVNRIVDYYGKSNVISVSVAELLDGHIITKDEIGEDLFSDFNW